jgi:hypothetical protein
LLEAMIADNPQHDLIPKVVNGLLAHRTKGRWGNTQENVFILLSLDRYFNTFEAQTPDFVARIWLGEAYAGGHEFIGRTTDQRETVIPMAYLVDEKRLGTGYALMTLCQQVGWASMAWALGRLNAAASASAANPAGYNPGMWLLSGLSVLGLFFSWMLWRHERSVPVR